MKTQNAPQPRDDDPVAADRRRTKALHRKTLYDFFALLAIAWITVLAVSCFATGGSGIIIGVLLAGPVFLLVIWRLQDRGSDNPGAGRVGVFQFSLRSLFFLTAFLAMIFAVIRAVSGDILSLLLFTSGLLAFLFLIYFPFVWEPHDHDLDEAGDGS